LSLSEAGLGCALWDASIILSRSLFAQRELLKGTKILEVGAGCGLPAIVAGLFANEVVGTDYIEKVISLY
jgi:predicted nicotinamide N-methyase